MPSPKKFGSSSSGWKIQFLLEVYQLDYQNQDNLKKTLNYLSEFFHRYGYSQVELVSLLRSKHKYGLKLNQFVSKDSYACGDKIIQDDEPCFDLWTGSVDVEESIDGLTNLIDSLAGPVGSLDPIVLAGGNYFLSDMFYKKIGFLWKFVENDDRFEKNSDFSAGSHSQPLNIKRFGFGNLINGTRFVEQFNSSNDLSELTDNPSLFMKHIDLVLRHTAETMELVFILSDSDEMDQRFKLDFEYKSVKTVTISRSKSGLNVFFHLSYPPKIYIATDDMDPYTIDMKKSKFWSFNYKTYRENPFPRQKLNKESWTRWHDCKCITSTCIGKCSVFSIYLENDSNRQAIVDLVNKFYLWRRYSNLDITFGFIEVIAGDNHPVDFFSDFPFEVNYALQCIQSISYGFQDDLIINKQSENLLTFIQDQITNNTELLITAMYRLCYDYFYGKVYHALSRLKTIFKRIKKHGSSIKNVNSSNSYIKQLRRAILTPTRVLILPELAFQSSQFLEIAEKDFILRLTLRDEDMSNLGYSVIRSHEDIKRENKRNESNEDCAKLPSPEMYFLGKCIVDRLLPSLDVAGKSYHFYGASSSQLREYGMVLYAKDSLGRDYEQIKNEIGQIKSKERPCISKYISRVGLSLTQVLAFVDLPLDTEIRYTEDVLAGKHSRSNNCYNFTDGCGLMSPQLAEYIWSDLKRQGVIKLNPDEEEKISTAYQIRFMGCKGMIVLDRNLTGNVIVLRESMRKLDSVLGKLGIVKISDSRRAYLNRPLITILNQVGLSNELFVALLSNAIGDLVDSFHCNIKASKALTMFSYLQRFINHTKLADLNYDLLGDPFFRSALNLVFHQGLDVIKQKARIPLDLSISRTLFGVADPTATHHLPYVVVPTGNGDDPDSQLIKIYDQNRQVIYSSPCSKKSLFFDEATEAALRTATSQSLKSRKGLLKYGQVFVFPSDFDKPLTCDVIVTKFPCMHPGDIRHMKAVNLPELHSIRDCIVFPVDGNRPHSNEMAGSDLDGDEYCVIWSPEFMGIKIDEPMEFPDESSSGSEPINNKEILNFYMRYLRDCVIGRIAISHLVWADMLPTGIFSDTCIKLAKKYSISLDFIKTGISETLEKDEIYPEAPDFTSKWDLKPSYHSARALGSIYRTISMFELFLAEETSKLKIIEPLTDPRLTHNNWKKYELEADKQHEIYCSIVFYLLEINGFSDEAELFTQISEKSSLFGATDEKMQRPSNYQDTMIYCVDHLLVKPMEKNFYEEFESEAWKTASQEELQEAYMAKASAYYKVSMKKMKKHKKSFCGLPWVGKYSVHLFDLLEKSKLSDKSKTTRLTANLNTRTVMGGFSGNQECRRIAANSCWMYLNQWLEKYLSSMDLPQHASKRIIDEMNELFQNIVKYYTSNLRKKESPGSVLKQIFLEIKSRQKSLNFQRNLFDSCNDPIGLMTVLILERKYYEGTAASKIPDGTFNCWSNSTFTVLMGEGTESKTDIQNLKLLLTDISGCVSIIVTPAITKPANCKLSVFGSRASILICQVIIGIHNRLKSSNPHYQSGMSI